MRVGFFAGAVGGLAIALLLVGLVAAFPQANPAIQASSPAAASQTTTTSQFANGQAGIGSAPLVAPSAAGAPNSSSSAGGPATFSKANIAATQRPDSLLAVLPSESEASLVGTISPLLLGLLAAALVYAAYSRRQDAPA
jgi:hypothetical protein